MSKVIRVKYENGVLKPLEPLEFDEGKELYIRIIRVEEKKKILNKYKGALGNVEKKLIEEAIEEAEHL